MCPILNCLLCWACDHYVFFVWQWRPRPRWQHFSAHLRKKTYLSNSNLCQFVDITSSLTDRLTFPPFLHLPPFPPIRMVIWRSWRSSEVSLETLLDEAACTFNLAENHGCPFLSLNFQTSIRYGICLRISAQYFLLISCLVSLSLFLLLSWYILDLQNDPNDLQGWVDWLDSTGMIEVDAAVTVKSEPSPERSPSPSLVPQAEQTYGLCNYKLLTPTTKSNVKILDMQSRRRKRGSTTPTRDLGPPGLLQETAVACTSLTPFPLLEASQDPFFCSSTRAFPCSICHSSTWAFCSSMRAF